MFFINSGRHCGPESHCLIDVDLLRGDAMLRSEMECNRMIKRDLKFRLPLISIVYHLSSIYYHNTPQIHNLTHIPTTPKILQPRPKLFILPQRLRLTRLNPIIRTTLRLPRHTPLLRRRMIPALLIIAIRDPPLPIPLNAQLQ